MGGVEKEKKERAAHHLGSKVFSSQENPFSVQRIGKTKVYFE